MKKIYRNRLPKDKEVKNTNVRVENGEVVVEVELKDKFEPKDGDFLAIDGGIFIYNPNSEAIHIGLNGYYAGMCSSKNIYIYKNGEDDGFGSIYNEGLRYATPEEKSAFLERLEKVYGKKWNAEKKCLEDIYIPKFGDIVRIEHPDVDCFKRNYVISIFPNKEVPKKSVDDFFDIANVNMDGYVDIDDPRASYNHNHVYLASPSEKKELFDKLAEVGKGWNEGTKRLEDIRWKPKLNEVYFHIDIYGNVLSNK